MSTPVNWGGNELPRIYNEGNVPETVEDLEKEGQRSFIESDTLPTEMDEITKDALEAAGVILGEVVPDDPLFRFATLPQGWQKSAGKHPTSVDILDTEGRRRYRVHFNPVSYNREASIEALLRYGTTIEKDDTHHVVVGKVVDGKQVIHITVPYKYDCEQLTSENAAKKSARARAREWLDLKYPDWLKPAAYWD